VPDADDILIIGGGLAGRTLVVVLEKGGGYRGPVPRRLIGRRRASNGRRPFLMPVGTATQQLLLSLLLILGEPQLNWARRSRWLITPVGRRPLSSETILRNSVNLGD
jgi:hypothetical protein